MDANYWLQKNSNMQQRKSKMYQDANLYLITNLYVEVNVNKILPPTTVFYLLHNINKLKVYYKKKKLLLQRKENIIIFVDFWNKYRGKPNHIILSFTDVQQVSSRTRIIFYSG